MLGPIFRRVHDDVYDAQAVFKARMRRRRWWRGIPALWLAAALAACGDVRAQAQHHPAASHRAVSALTQQLSGARAMSAGFGQPLSNFSAAPPRNAGPVLAGEDSVNASAVKEGIAVASCYVVGSRFANCPAVAARHPQHILTVAVLPSLTARCLDVEPTDATPQQAPAWAWNMIRNHGITHPCFYAGGSWMGAVQSAAAASGLPHCTPQTAASTKPCYLTHIAVWDGNPAIPPGQDGKQYQSFPSVDLDSYYAYYFAQPKPQKPKLTGTANFDGAFGASWVWGIHSAKGSVKGQSGYKNGIAAEVQVGRSHRFRIKGMPATAPPISGKAIQVWWPLKHVLFPFGVHFTFGKNQWAVWGKRGTVPTLPKGCDRLSAQIYMAAHGANKFKPEIQKMVCDAGPLFGASR